MRIGQTATISARGMLETAILALETTVAPVINLVFFCRPNYTKSSDSGRLLSWKKRKIERQQAGSLVSSCAMDATYSPLDGTKFQRKLLGGGMEI